LGTNLIVLDTHVWLWVTLQPNRLSRRARLAIEEAETIGISTISCWEIALLGRIGRIEFLRDVRLWIRQALAHERVEALPLTADAAVEAALLGERFPGDPADRMIYATARTHEAPLVTKDRRIRRFDRATTVW
jgi:PIN domain nuclease of toxin-antitoxin system